jgi:CheY-like chemotaxis protein
MANDVTFLIVEDDEVDIMALERSFDQLRIANKKIVAKDGVEGLEFLRGEGGRDRIEPPFIVLLDLNMPRMNGLEFLEEIRNDATLHKSVVFVLTTSDVIVIRYLPKRSMSLAIS